MAGTLERYAKAWRQLTLTPRRRSLTCQPHAGVIAGRPGSGALVCINPRGDVAQMMAMANILLLAGKRQWKDIIGG